MTGVLWISMNILIFGDIFGSPGRRAVKKHIKRLQHEYEIDFTIANVENLAHGKGITRGTVNEMREAGVDFCTSGNHIWKNPTEMAPLLGKSPRVIRPANYPPMCPGTGWQIVNVQGRHGRAARGAKKIMATKVLVINLMGRVFMGSVLDCPFRAFDAIMEETKKLKPDVVVVDFHAEASSEKVALGHYIDGRATLLFGTHTHVPTADARVLPGGTGYITDVGFTGPRESIIGVDIKSGIRHFLTQMPLKGEVAGGEAVLNALVCKTGDNRANAQKKSEIAHAISLELVRLDPAE